MLVEAFETAFPNHNFNWRNSGSCAQGFCPFHTDKHQRSLGIYTDARGRERWHCFAEGIGGGLIDLVLRSKIPNTETRAGANYWLVQKGYLQETEQQVKDRLRNDGLTKFLAWTNSLLETSDDAAGLRAYLAGRRIDIRTIPNSPIGYYPKVEEVEAWLAENELLELLGSELIPTHRCEGIVVGSILFFYRTSYEEYSRIKVRNVLKERDGNKMTMYLGKKLRRGERIGYFSWTKEGCYDRDDAILVEGEFDVGALFSMCARESDEDIVEPIYCFSGGTNLSSGVSALLDMGKTHIYLFPDNDDVGIDYSYTVAEQHTQTYVIMPVDYQQGDDPATWAASHNVTQFNEAYTSRRPAFAWIGQKLANMAQEATMEDQAAIKVKLIEYAKKLPATDREMFLKNYGTVAGVSFEALMEEVDDRSQIKYRKVLNPAHVGILMNVINKNTSEWEPISNVILETERDLILDAGDDNVERKIVLRVSMAYKSTKIELTPEEYADDKRLYSAIITALGSSVWIKPRTVSYLREACNLLTPIKETGGEENIYTHTGWREDKFLAPNGYVDADGFHPLDDIKVELPANPGYMKNYRLDEPPADLTLIRDVIKNDMLKVFSYDITLPYLAHVFWSPLAHFIPMAKPVCLWVVGLTGSYKTSYTGLMASFFGDFKTGDFETWRSTTNSIEKNGYYLKDMLYVVDDYKGIDVNPKALTGCIQSYGDRHGRGRMNTDLSARKTWFIRGNMVSTAEDIPTGEASVISRILLLKIPGRGNSDHLTKAQAHAKLLPGVMAKFIQFLCNKKIREHDYEKLLAERRNKFKAVHGRVCESLAANSIAWDLVAEFLGLEDLTEDYYRGVSNVLATMNLTTKQEQAGYVFQETLADLIDSGNFHLEGLGCNGTEHLETSQRLGWINSQHVYILGSKALAEVNKLRMQLTGSPIKYTANTIYEQLVAAGTVIPDANGKPTKVIKVNNRSSARVLEFRRGVVEKLGDEAFNDNSKLTSGVLRDAPECNGLELS